MLVTQQRVSGATEKDQAKQVPLDFEQGVRAVIKGVAHQRIAGADHDDDQHQPDRGFADARRGRVDQARELEKGVHGGPRGLWRAGFIVVVATARLYGARLPFPERRAAGLADFGFRAASE